MMIVLCPGRRTLFHSGQSCRRAGIIHVLSAVTGYSLLVCKAKHELFVGCINVSLVIFIRGHIAILEKKIAWCEKTILGWSFLNSPLSLSEWTMSLIFHDNWGKAVFLFKEQKGTWEQIRHAERCTRKTKGKDQLSWVFLHQFQNHYKVKSSVQSNICQSEFKLKIMNEIYRFINVADMWCVPQNNDGWDFVREASVHVCPEHLQSIVRCSPLGMQHSRRSQAVHCRTVPFYGKKHEKSKRNRFAVWPSWQVWSKTQALIFTCAQSACSVQRVFVSQCFAVNFNMSGFFPLFVCFWQQCSSFNFFLIALES